MLGPFKRRSGFTAGLFLTQVKSPLSQPKAVGASSSSHWGPSLPSPLPSQPLATAVLLPVSKNISPSLFHSPNEALLHSLVIGAQPSGVSQGGGSIISCNLVWSWEKTSTSLTLIRKYFSEVQRHL